MPIPTAPRRKRSFRQGNRPIAALCSLLTLSLVPAAVMAQTPATQTPALPPVDNPVQPPTPLTPSLAAPAETPTGEVRAMWVVRDSMTSPAKIRNVVALAKKYGFNTLFVQVRGRGDAFYDSRFEPRAEELSDQPSDFDPLALAIEEGHRAGLEVHAWMNTFLVWSKGRRPYSGQHIVNRHPEWLVQDRECHCRTTPTSDCEGGFLDPALPGVAEHTRNVFLDVATRYNVDGIHFDYVRYPSERYSFSDTDLNAFRAHMMIELSENDAAYADLKAKKNRLAWVYLFPREWKDWRRGNVTEVVRGISEEVHRLKPNIIVSAAVFPNYSVAIVDKGQSWRDWLRDGILDAVCPMTYNKDTGLVGAQVREAVANSYGRPVVPGVGAWQMPADSAIAKGTVYRQLGASGMNFFSYDGMTREGRTEAYLQKVAGALFHSPTLPPNWHRPVATARNTERNADENKPKDGNGVLDLRPVR